MSFVLSLIIYIRIIYQHK